MLLPAASNAGEVESWERWLEVEAGDRAVVADWKAALQDKNRSGFKGGRGADRRLLVVAEEIGRAHV